jgi:hypothetical protein
VLINTPLSKVRRITRLSPALIPAKCQVSAISKKYNIVICLARTSQRASVASYS